MKATTVFFKFWSVIMIMPSHLWICWQVVSDRSLWLILLLCLFPEYFLFDWSCQWLWLGATDLLSYQYFGAGFGQVIWTAFDLLFVELHQKSESFSSIYLFLHFLWMEILELAYPIQTTQELVFLQLFSFTSLWVLLYWYALLPWYVMLT